MSDIKDSNGEMLPPSAAVPTTYAASVSVKMALDRLPVEPPRRWR
jgi:hypothetical protein